MGLFIWCREYEIGHPLIDQQHRHLFDLINQLDDAVAVNLNH